VENTSQDTDEQFFDNVTSELMGLMQDDPEKFKELKEKLRLKCEENNAMPEEKFKELDAKDENATAAGA
jgi:hypothetical protein